MSFIVNKYTHWYNQIINQAQDRVLINNGYTETHHIIPKSLGGSNAKDNLVKLTAREHFVAHWLLTKMVVNTKQKYQMWNAFSCMLYRELPGKQRYKVSSRIFENIKAAGSKIKSEKMSGTGNPLYGKRGSAHPAYGMTWSDEHRKNASESHKGKIRTLESRAKQSKTNKGIPKSKEHREKTSISLLGKNNPMYGKKLSPETIAKRTSSLQRNKLAKKLAKENQNS
jgi:hypothetical protein